MTKQESFEIVYADQNNMRPEDFAQYRMGDTYRLPAIARAHRYFCSGWDAAEAESDEEINAIAPMTQEEFESMPENYQEAMRRVWACSLFGDVCSEPKTFTGLAPKADTE